MITAKTVLETRALINALWVASGALPDLWTRPRTAPPRWIGTWRAQQGAPRSLPLLGLQPPNLLMFVEYKTATTRGGDESTGGLNSQCYSRMTGTWEAVTTCKCAGQVMDTTAPSLSDVLGSQASPSAVTVTGAVNEASTVYCNVAASGHAHTPADVKAAGFSDSVSSSGSFTVTVTGVSGEGTKSVACVGEDTASNLAATVSSGTDFPFGTRRQCVACCRQHSCAGLIRALPCANRHHRPHRE